MKRKRGVVGFRETKPNERRTLEPGTAEGITSPDNPCWLLVVDGDAAPIFTIHHHSKELATGFACMISEAQDWPIVQLVQLDECDHAIPLGAVSFQLTNLTNPTAPAPTAPEGTAPR